MPRKLPPHVQVTNDITEKFGKGGLTYAIFFWDTDHKYLMSFDQSHKSTFK